MNPCLWGAIVVGLGGRRRRPAHRFGGLSFAGQRSGHVKLGATVVSALVMMGALFAPVTAGAQEAPGEDVEIFATLYPECEIDGEISPPFLEVENSSDEPVEVTAGEVTFTVEGLDYEYRDVPAELTADQVLIDGVPGLVEIGSCDDFDDFDGFLGEGFGDLFTATFTSGCPADAPPGLARLEVRLTAEGEALLKEDFGLDELDELGLDPFPFPFEIDDDMVLVRLPDGLNLLLEADATVPEVKFFDVKLPVERRQGVCAGAPAGPAPTPTVAAPLAPKFAG